MRLPTYDCSTRRRKEVRDALTAKVAASRHVPDRTEREAGGGAPGLRRWRAWPGAGEIGAQAIYAELDGRKLRLVPMTGGATDAGFATRSGRTAVLGASVCRAGAITPGTNTSRSMPSCRLYLSVRLLQDLAANPVK